MKDSLILRLILFTTCMLLLICGTMAEGKEVHVKDKLQKISTHPDGINIDDFHSNETFTPDYFDNLDLDNTTQTDLLENGSYPNDNKFTNDSVKNTEETNNDVLKNDKHPTLEKKEQNGDEQEKENKGNNHEKENDKEHNPNSDKDHSLVGIHENGKKDNVDHTEYRSEYRALFELCRAKMN